MTVAKPTPLSGFPELLPAERFVELRVLDSLRASFELHGFAPVETRAAEPLEQLLRKGEIDKEVYLLRRLQAKDDAESGDAEPADSSALGLHFDLTVPFARYVLENAGKLEFPFRRYQIQKVWRGERPQEGRYREFTQADIDVVARDVLPFHHDVEVARAMAEALSQLPVPPLKLQVNNRKLIEGSLGAVRGRGRRDAVIDKIDKVRSTIIATMLEPRPAWVPPGRVVPGAGRHPGLGSSFWSGSGARDRAQLLEEAGRARRRDRGGAQLGTDRFQGGRPADRPGAWTTTPAPSSRPGWPASRAWARSVPAALRLPRQRRPDQLSGVGISLGVTRMRCRCSTARVDGQPVVPSAVLVALRRRAVLAGGDVIVPGGAHRGRRRGVWRAQKH